MVTRICDRQNGLGADGILYGPFLDDGAIGLVIYNSNGTECGRSGNGLSIFAHYLYGQGRATADELSIRTSAGHTTVRRVDFEEGLFSLDAGPFSFEKRTIPVGPLAPSMLEKIPGCENSAVEINYVENGNPHCVMFVDGFSPDDTISLGRYVNGLAVFPEGVNLQTVERVDRHRVNAQVFERGAGYTLSSAASACAISAVTHTLGLSEPTMEVLMPGGKFSAQVSDDQHVLLTVSVASICDGEFCASYVDGLKNA